MIAAPFREYSTVVPPEWIDMNDHMNARYYTIVIYNAHSLFSQAIGFTEDYVNTQRCGKSVVESHLVYERELRVGDRIEVASRLLAVGEKRLHFYHEVFNADKGHRAAVGEQLDIYVDLNTRRAANIPTEFFAHLKSIAAEHEKLPAPDKIGRHVTMERR
jgi:acyl-CoA thioester hydrolase